MVSLCNKTNALAHTALYHLVAHLIASTRVVPAHRRKLYKCLDNVKLFRRQCIIVAHARASIIVVVIGRVTDTLTCDVISTNVTDAANVIIWLCLIRRK